LVLRNPLDMEPAKVPGTMMANLYGTMPKVKPEAAPAPVRSHATMIARVAAPVQPVIQVTPPPPPYHIEIINGGKQSEVKFARVREEKP